jgi:hypothetical protein
MKTIKVWFLDYGKNVPDDFKLYKILKRNYTVQLVEKDPDYVIFGDHSYDYLKYDCIRIHYSIEQGSPDFDLVDYEIGYDYIKFSDRYIRYPYYLFRLFRDSKLDNLNVRDLDYYDFNSKDLFLNRDFCCFISSNGEQKSNRDELYKKLSQYKRVNSAGSHLNNMNNKYLSNKIEFQYKHKFSIAAENSIYDGYTTEKIYESFLSRTIPIYLGNPKIDLEFNPNSFINANKFSNFDDLIEYIKELDRNDNKYIEILTAKKVLNNSTIPEESELENFLLNIFDQSIVEAKRRPNSQRSLYKSRIWSIGSKLIVIYRRIPRRIKEILKFIIYKNEL